jgi:hypothetical protein
MAACLGDGCWHLLERRPGDLRQLRRLSRWRTATNDEPLHVHGPNIAMVAAPEYSYRLAVST